MVYFSSDVDNGLIPQETQRIIYCYTLPSLGPKRLKRRNHVLVYIA